MSDQETNEIISLQGHLIRRLGELGAIGPGADNLARQLAHIAVLGRSFAERSMPLFLSIEAGHAGSLQMLLVAIKQDLEELQDAIRDLEPDLSDLIDNISNQQEH